MPPDNDLTRDRLLAEESEKIGERAPIQRVVKRQCGKSNAQSNETSAEPSKSTNHFPNLSRRIRGRARAWGAEGRTKGQNWRIVIQRHTRSTSPSSLECRAPECKGAAFL